MWNISSNYQPQMKKETSSSTFQCNKQPSILCINNRCQKNAFMCQNQDCKCHKQHQNCLEISVKKVTKNILSKIVSVQKFSDIISIRMDKQIDHLSEMKENILKYINATFKNLGLTQKQCMLAQIPGFKKIESITGKHLSQNFLSHQKLERQKLIQNEVSKLENLFGQNTFWNKLHLQMLETGESIMNHLKQLQSNSYFNLYNNEFFQNSNIIMDKILKRNIFEMFELKRIYATKSLYKATQNGFNIEKFYEKCSNFSNTVTICKTQFGKIIGGFTPLKWIRPTSNGYEKDSSKQSFIFNLSNNDKFLLSQQDYAVYRCLEYGPTFGDGYDLHITKKANEKNKSYARLNYSYKNASYIKNDKSSWQRFCGNPDDYEFKISEWEVWEMSFKKQQSKMKT